MGMASTIMKCRNKDNWNTVVDGKKGGDRIEVVGEILLLVGGEEGQKKKFHENLPAPFKVMAGRPAELREASSPKSLPPTPGAKPGTFGPAVCLVCAKETLQAVGKMQCSTTIILSCLHQLVI